MSLFLHTYEPPFAQIDKAVDALQNRKPVAFIVNKDPNVFCVFVSTAEQGLPYEVDFVCTEAFDPDSAEPPKPMPMTFDDRKRITAWTKKVIQTICRRWRKKYPEN